MRVADPRVIIATAKLAQAELAQLNANLAALTPEQAKTLKQMIRATPASFRIGSIGSLGRGES